MRQRNSGGRFNQRFDLENIFEGMSDDLQGYEGQVILWYSFDLATSHIDPIYDVGDSGADGGRSWKAPFAIPVLSVIRTEGAEESEEQGLYSSDSLHLVISYDQAGKVGLTDIDHRSDDYLNDRFVWNDTVYTPTKIQARGLVRHQYTVIGIDALQVNPEELINDPRFALYALR